MSLFGVAVLYAPLSSSAQGNAKESRTVSREMIADRIYSNHKAALGPSVQKADVVDVCRAVVYTLADTLQNGTAVKLSRFGALGLRDRPPREAKNPLTGERVQVGATRSVSFRASHGLRDRLNHRQR